MRLSAAILLLAVLPRLAVGMNVQASLCVAPGHIGIECHEDTDCGETSACLESHDQPCVDIALVATDAQRAAVPHCDLNPAAFSVPAAPALAAPAEPAAVDSTGLEAPSDRLSARALARAVKPRR